MKEILGMLNSYYNQNESMRNEKPFSVELFTQTFQKLVGKGKNYSNRIIAFTKYLKYVGGKGIIKVLRGIPGYKNKPPKLSDSILGIPCNNFLKF